jgi:hypothetical protein
VANALREFWPTGVLFLVGLGFDLSPVRSDPVAYVLWALAALWALYAGIPQINRIRVGLKPPDAELREALEARDRWREHFEAKQSEVQKLNVVREQQLEKIREVEQVLQRLRDRNEQLDQLNKNLQAERDQLSDLLQETKRENAKLKAERDELKAGERRKRIEEWRSAITNHEFGGYPRFASTVAYSQMKPHLRLKVVEMLEAPRTLHVGTEARGDTAYRYTLLDEVARIEKEWGLI